MIIEAIEEYTDSVFEFEDTDGNYWECLDVDKFDDDLWDYIIDDYIETHKSIVKCDEDLQDYHKNYESLLPIINEFILTMDFINEYSIVTRNI